LHLRYFGQDHCQERGERGRRHQRRDDYVRGNYQRNGEGTVGSGEISGVGFQPAQVIRSCKRVLELTMNENPYQSPSEADAQPAARAGISLWVWLMFSIAVGCICGGIAFFSIGIAGDIW